METKEMQERLTELRNLLEAAEAETKLIGERYTEAIKKENTLRIEANVLNGLIRSEGVYDDREIHIFRMWKREVWHGLGNDISINMLIQELREADYIFARFDSDADVDGRDYEEFEIFYGNAVHDSETQVLSAWLYGDQYWFKPLVIALAEYFETNERHDEQVIRHNSMSREHIGKMIRSTLDYLR